MHTHHVQILYGYDDEGQELNLGIVCYTELGIIETLQAREANVVYLTCQSLSSCSKASVARVASPYQKDGLPSAFSCDLSFHQKSVTLHSYISIH